MWCVFLEMKHMWCVYLEMLISVMSLQYTLLYGLNIISIGCITTESEVIIGAISDIAPYSDIVYLNLTADFLTRLKCNLTRLKCNFT